MSMNYFLTKAMRLDASRGWGAGGGAAAAVVSGSGLGSGVLVGGGPVMASAPRGDGLTLASVMTAAEDVKAMKDSPKYLGASGAAKLVPLASGPHSHEQPLAALGAGGGSLVAVPTAAAADPVAFAAASAAATLAAGAGIPLPSLSPQLLGLPDLSQLGALIYLHQQQQQQQQQQPQRMSQVGDQSRGGGGSSSTSKMSSTPSVLAYYAYLQPSSYGAL